jgi:hypothetical protein
MIIKTRKNSLLNSRDLLYIGYFAFLISVIASKISHGKWFHEFIINESISPRIFDFLSGFGSGLAIITILASILIRRFCDTE